MNLCWIVMFCFGPAGIRCDVTCTALAVSNRAQRFSPMWVWRKGATYEKATEAWTVWEMFSVAACCDVVVFQILIFSSLICCFWFTYTSPPLCKDPFLQSHSSIHHPSTHLQCQRAWLKSLIYVEIVSVMLQGLWWKQQSQPKVQKAAHVPSLVLTHWVSPGWQSLWQLSGMLHSGLPA